MTPLLDDKLIDSLTTLASQGRMSLQVPEYNLVIDADGLPQWSAVDILAACPEELIFRVHDGRVAFGRETGFLHLTRRGYESMKPMLKEAFEKAIANGLDRTGGKGWPAFEEKAEAFFASVEKKTARWEEKLVKQLADVRASDWRSLCEVKP